MHLSNGRITLCAPKSRSGTLARFCAMVWPVTVIQSPKIHPNFSKYFMTAGMPPMRCTSSIRNLPLGFKSAIKEVLSLIRWKSSMVSSISAVAAMASKCSTALVDPPKAFTMTMAFSKDFFVRMSEGRRFLSSMPFTHFATRWHSARFSGDAAGEELEYGRDKPKASVAVAMVLAVYIPPHAPGPGHALRTMSFLSSSEMVPAMYLP
mmetsp:Transcript_65180/g.79774  ORF Transcript_65180/g.79774 Transcript_65180/m.79774 type:complete len:207 (-) Transcript_65180:459-1079(-)